MSHKILFFRCLEVVINSVDHFCVYVSICVRIFQQVFQNSENSENGIIMQNILERRILFTKKKNSIDLYRSFFFFLKGFPVGSVVKEFICQCRGHGFHHLSRKIPHAVGQLSPGA